MVVTKRSFIILLLCTAVVINSCAIFENQPVGIQILMGAALGLAGAVSFVMIKNGQNPLDYIPADMGGNVGRTSTTSSSRSSGSPSTSGGGTSSSSIIPVNTCVALYHLEIDPNAGLFTAPYEARNTCSFKISLGWCYGADCAASSLDSNEITKMTTTREYDHLGPIWVARKWPDIPRPETGCCV
jgi:hypothetical protein